MNEDLSRLKDIKIENYIWIIYIGIIVLSWYANSKEKDFIINKNENSKKEYQALMILIFTILLFIYYYFTIDSYDDVKELTPLDSKKKIILRYASFVGSFLILISGIIFLIIAILDDNIDTEIAFN
ncbi:hypothetical protein EGP99_06135 [bacterium]|nr:hypothetical protein [bacterium]